MKKVFAIMAIAGIMVACNNKKSDKKEGENADTSKMENTNTMTDTSKMQNNADTTKMADSSNKMN